MNWYGDYLMARLAAEERVEGRRRERIRLSRKVDGLEIVRPLVRLVMSWLF